MTNPSIDDAKALALTHRKRGVIILAFDGKRFSGVSYGMRRADCRAVGRTLDQICDRLSSGDIAPAFGDADAGPLEKAGESEVNAELLAACEQAYSLIGPQYAGESLAVSQQIAAAIVKAKGAAP